MEEFEIEEKQGDTTKCKCCWKFSYLAFCCFLLAGFMALIVYSFALRYERVEVETINHHGEALTVDDDEDGSCEEDYCLTKGCISVAARMVTLMDEKKDPCVDFYDYACGNYHETKSVRFGEDVYDSFTEVKDNILVFIKKSFDDLSGVTITESFNKTKQLFDSCMDNERGKTNTTLHLTSFLEKSGILWPILENDSYAEAYTWTHVVAVMEKYGFHTLFQPKFTTFDNNQTVIIDVDCSVVTFPVHYYTTPGKKEYEDLLSWYENVIILMLHHMNISRPDAKPVAKRIIEVERLLAQALMDIEEIEEGMRDCDRPCEKSWCVPCKEQTVADRYPLSADHVEELQNIWSSLLKRSTSDIHIRSICPHNLEAALRALHDAPARSLLNFIGWRATMHLPQYMGTRYQYLYNHYVERMLQTTTLPTAKWRECSDIVRRQLSLPVAKMLMEKFYIKDNQIKEMERRFDEMKEAFKATLRTIPWLDNQTLVAFGVKLDKMTLQIGYPSYLEDSEKMDEVYNELHIDPSDSFFNNILHLREFETKRNYARLTNDYSTDKLSVIDLNHCYLDSNANYDYIKNEVCVDFGLLFSPIFKFGEGLAGYLEYGQNVLVAREISRAFDAKGIDYDGNGNYLGTESLPEIINRNFHSFVLCLMEQQAMTIPAEIDKDMADLGAAFITSAGLELHLLKEMHELEKPLPALPKSKVQLYFLQSAQLFCQLANKPVLDFPPNGKKSRKERLHAIMANMVNFGAAFGCSTGTPMNPHKKCNLLSV